MIYSDLSVFHFHVGQEHPLGERSRGQPPVLLALIEARKGKICFQAWREMEFKGGSQGELAHIKDNGPCGIYVRCKRTLWCLFPFMCRSQEAEQWCCWVCGVPHPDVV